MSRTSNSIKNSEIAILFYFLEIILGFFSRKVFIDYIGAEVLGLNTTANNLLQFLNLAEMGIGSAIAFTLYKPISQHNNHEIREIIQVQGWLYKKISLCVSIGAIILMLFFPLIFKKITIPLWYAYASFGVLLYTSLLTYFWNYRQIILTASQKEYKITLSYKFIIIIKQIVQILAIVYLSNGYEWWLGLQVIFATLASYNLNRVISREFPYLKGLKTNVKGIVANKYSALVKKIKQLFFHKFAGYVLNQTSPLIIYAYTTLTAVAVYGNYMLIVSGVTMLLTAMFNGVAASVGDLISEGNKERTLTIFRELFTARFYVTTIAISCILMTINDFITLWVGSEYLFPEITIYIILGIMYINTMRTVVDNFIFGLGMFQDIWAPMAEAAINIILSITLGYFFGINGILSGVLISLFLIVFLWKPIFLFHFGIKSSILKYYVFYLKHIAIFLLSLFLLHFLLEKMHIIVTSYSLWLLKIAVIFVAMGSFELIMLYTVCESMRQFVMRVKKILRR